MSDIALLWKKINDLQARAEQVYGRSPEELEELRARGITEPSVDELREGIQILRQIRLGQTSAPAKPTGKLPPGVSIDDF